MGNFPGYSLVEQYILVNNSMFLKIQINPFY